MASSQKHRQIMAKNDNLHKAKRAKADEFYTQLSDIEDETNGFVTYDRAVLKVNEDRMLKIAKSLYEKSNSQEKINEASDML